jgi:hypothetical protein
MLRIYEDALFMLERLALVSRKRTAQMVLSFAAIDSSMAAR